MPPKNKGKKGKKQDDDEFWAQAGESVAGNNVAVLDGEDENNAQTSKGKFSGFAALGIDVGNEEEEEDFGGLMSVIKASAKKGKKDKDKKAKKNASFVDGPGPGEGSDGEAAAAKGDISAPKKATAVTADELADEEWGPVKGKGKKGKKKGKKGKADEDDEDDGFAKEAEVEEPAGDLEAKKPVEVTAEELADEEWGPVKEKKGKKGKKGKKVDEEDEAPAPSEPTSSVAAPDKEADEDGDEEPGMRVLSKKEKEKLKKEKEKAKKKAQAAAKKAATADGDDTAPPTAPSAEAEKDEDEEDEGAAGVGAAKKKKKKKPAKKEEEPAPTPAPAAGKKKGGLGALKAMMEERKRLEEEARKREEEERKRIEEEEQRIAEEERKKEEEKQRRKEKEKAKRELAKKEGRLLTKKQKEEQKAAEIRRQALLASGVHIEGLQRQAGGSAPRKVTYGNRKRDKQAVSVTDSRASTPAPESKPATPPPASPIPPDDVAEAPEAAGSKDGVKDDWDASSEGEAPAQKSVPGVKDDWDASTDEEEEKPPVKAESVTKKPEAKSAATNGKATASKASAAKAEPKKAAATAPSKNAAGAASKKPVAAAEESSEEESSEESSDEESSEEDSDSESEEEGRSHAQRLAAQKKAEAAERRAKAHEAALAARSKDNLRSPICCILGHVDTGKTKLLDKIRQTNVQEGEAGGITQQIGATYFPVDAIKTKTAVINKDGKQEYNVPGLLIIDTPGHESFTNLRSRGSSLCNIAILVVDIMHGLEQQTLESLRLLKDRKTPFIVALNKIDRLYGWEPTPDNAVQDSLAKQKPSVIREFQDKVQKIIVAFAEQGLNSILYYENKNFARNVSIVPTSAVTGEGVPDMIMLLVNLTQQRMSDRLMYLSELECTVLEVKVIEGLGTTIDVVLSNGILREGDRIVVCGLNGPIVTTVRALLTPQPLRELRIKSQYVHHKEVKAALGVKIAANDLEKAIAGSRLLVVGPDDDEDDLRDEVMADLTTLLSSIDKSGRGVCVQASTLGSLEALLDFLKSSKIPVSGINIGPVHKKDVMRCATMLEKAKELACILCFDVTVDKEAERLAEELGVKLFKADIIYHLFDAFKKYNEEIAEAKRRDAAPQAIWPCRLKVIAAFAKRDPIILGVDILDGTLRVGTPLCVVKIDPVTQRREIIDLGKITSLEINHKSMDIVKKSQAGGGVAVKIEHAVYQSAKMFGRHFDEKDEIVSHVTRTSIDVLKASFKADVTTEEWLLIKALKGPLGIL